VICAGCSKCSKEGLLTRVIQLETEQDDARNQIAVLRKERDVLLEALKVYIDNCRWIARDAEVKSRRKRFPQIRGQVETQAVPMMSLRAARGRGQGQI
jgi:hypothetical protein